MPPGVDVALEGLGVPLISWRGQTHRWHAHLGLSAERVCYPSREIAASTQGATPVSAQNYPQRAREVPVAVMLRFINTVTYVRVF